MVPHDQYLGLVDCHKGRRLLSTYVLVIHHSFMIDVFLKFLGLILNDDLPCPFGWAEVTEGCRIHIEVLLDFCI